MRPLLLRWVEEEDEWHLMLLTTLGVVATARK
jgi:predicted cation transporter